jgi:hypothetical protein
MSSPQPIISFTVCNTSSSSDVNSGSVCRKINVFNTAPTTAAATAPDAKLMAPPMPGRGGIGGIGKGTTRPFFPPMMG